MYVQLTLVGNVGRDPELRYVGEGIAVTDFTVAITKKVGQEKTTQWIKVVAWRQLAETVVQYVKKGKQVLISASDIEIESWQGQDGTTRTQLKVTAQNITFLGKREDDGQTDAVYSSKPDNNDADIPF